MSRSFKTTSRDSLVSFRDSHVLSLGSRTPPRHSHVLRRHSHVLRRHSHVPPRHSHVPPRHSHESGNQLGRPGGLILIAIIACLGLLGCSNGEAISETTSSADSDAIDAIPEIVAGLGFESTQGGSGFIASIAFLGDLNLEGEEDAEPTDAAVFISDLEANIADISADGGIEARIPGAQTQQDPAASQNVATPSATLVELDIVELDSEGDDLTLVQQGLSAIEDQESALIVTSSEEDFEVLSVSVQGTDLLVFGPTSSNVGGYCQATDDATRVPLDLDSEPVVDVIASQLVETIEFAATSGTLSRGSIFAAATELSDC